MPAIKHVKFHAQLSWVWKKFYNPGSFQSWFATFRTYCIKYFMALLKMKFIFLKATHKQTNSFHHIETAVISSHLEVYHFVKSVYGCHRLKRTNQVANKINSNFMEGRRNNPCQCQIWNIRKLDAFNQFHCQITFKTMVPI